MSFLIEHQVQKCIHHHQLQNKTFLLAVSGGVDSMVLAHIFKIVQKIEHFPAFALAHCNFSLRAQASDADEAFVKDWAEKNKILCFSKKIDPKLFLKTSNNPNYTSQENIQNVARNLRYSFFKELEDIFPYHYLVTAHHLNDQAETFLLHTLRGSSVKGLVGMSVLKKMELDKDKKPVFPNIFRPFLSIPKTELEMYAKKNKIPFRQDQSNFSNDYKRNFLRNMIFPPLLAYQNNSLQMIEKTMRFLQEDQKFLDKKIDEIWQKMTIYSHDLNVYKIDIQHWDSEKEYVFRKKMNQKFGSNLTVLDNICTAIQQKKSGKKFKSGNYQMHLNLLCLSIS
jgi:tRNA(Ile)-lysidine synthase